MVRAPCCEKMGLKKGPWTPEEDQILINYIRLHGHNNWRALPKLAGLLRCGKSCRLRWTNYLRPDIKRGNFTQDEEETIIKLHEMLGNRWSAIAARLPGRTDNEIKNVWHTHLKKKLPPSTNPGSAATTIISATTKNVAAGPTNKRSRKTNESKRNVVPKKKASTKTHEKSMEPNDNDDKTSDPIIIIIKTEPCTSDVSTVTSTSETDITRDETDTTRVENTGGGHDYLNDLPEINDDFWMEVLSVEDTAMSTEDIPSISQLDDCGLGMDPIFDTNVNSEDMDVFWHNLLTKSDELPEISEII
ncbi:hypothetical protein RND81_10G244900 [Saponaria officinalis]|uniref:Uncharacterized protein n=1 Tax=Saponaria officinalis TaxID=3572 RepID=A0AAW1I6E3_SAPOF